MIIRSRSEVQGDDNDADAPPPPSMAGAVSSCFSPPPFIFFLVRFRYVVAVTVVEARPGLRESDPSPRQVEVEPMSHQGVGPQDGRSRALEGYAEPVQAVPQPIHVVNGGDGEEDVPWIFRIEIRSRHSRRTVGIEEGRRRPLRFGVVGLGEGGTGG